MSEPRPPCALFVLEQHLGHRTYAQNLQRFVAPDVTLAAAWAPVHYAPSRAAWEKLPGLPASLRGGLRGRHEVRRALAENPHDVVFFNTQVPAVLGGRLSRCRPYVVATDLTPIQYDVIGKRYSHRADRFSPLAWYKRRVNQAVFRGAAKLLPWSSWAMSSLVRDYGVPPERVLVLPPGVDLELWRPGGARAAGPPRILFVGADFRRKGGPALLEAFGALRPGLAELVLVTRSEPSPAPGVVWHRGLEPNSPELVALYRSCDLFVLPTEAEAFGIAAVEACAAGLPVVASAVGGLPDVVAAGETGLLVPPGDVSALRAAVSALIDDAPRRLGMGRAGRARAESLFDARKNAAQVVACLTAALRRGSPGLFMRPD